VTAFFWFSGKKSEINNKYAKNKNNLFRSKNKYNIASKLHTKSDIT